MKLQLPSSVTRAFYRTGLQLKKHSPEILVVGGIVGGVVSAVMACKATTKLDTILEDHKDKVEQLNHAVENPELLPEPYSKEDHKKDMTIVYAKTSLELVKLYGPAVVLGTLSIASVLAGHNITRKRNIALAAAYTAVDTSFKEYRGRVVDRFGEALDKELRYNIKTKEVEEIVTNEDGSESVVKKKVDVVEKSDHSEYARFFMEGCPNWCKSPEYNFNFLKNQQRFANDRLKIQGHLFLNEVYDMLGFDRTKAGNIVGWIYDPKNPDIDNFVDFGIFGDYENSANCRFVNGWEPVILLDFNVDGPILEMI